ncbi:L-rhamnose mutarotase [Microbacteriaceae bacterium VKM Ac-2854]|nr:L-rhamnose mutarotase [Microbacteriaceae bacterium VKM Ac-2854]
MSAERYAAVIRLLPERADEYRALHRDVWPEVLAALERSHIRNYSIFLRDGLLFSYFEYTGSDYERDQELIAADPTTRRWWRLTDPCQEPLATAESGARWARAEEVFHVD